jgi:hypothetical protein
MLLVGGEDDENSSKRARVIGVAAGRARGSRGALEALKDIVVPLETPDEDARYEYALLGAYLLRITRSDDGVEIWRSGEWLGFGLTGADVRDDRETILLTAPALNSLVRR